MAASFTSRSLPPSTASELSSADGLPYARGRIIASTVDDLRKLRRAWEIVARRHEDGTLVDLTGLERSLPLDPAADSHLDDEIAAATHSARLVEVALEHLGGRPGRDDAFLANRLTAALVASMQVLVSPGSTVVGLSPSYTHPALARAIRLAGGELADTADLAEFESLLQSHGSLAVLTRLAVTYDALPEDDLVRAVAAARERGVPVFVDDAGGARVAPAVLGQPKLLELAVEAGATGLDKYGTLGPRLGLVAGRAPLIERIRARAFELGLEARPMLYPAAVRSLEQYRPERVRELVATTGLVGEVFERRLGAVVERTPFAVRLPGEAVLAEAMRRGGRESSPLVPIEATAALAMLLLRDHGVHTVHFAALPPGTSALLFKFVVPERLELVGGADALAAAIDSTLDELAFLLGDERALRTLLLG